MLCRLTRGRKLGTAVPSAVAIAWHGTWWHGTGVALFGGAHCCCQTSLLLDVLAASMVEWLVLWLAWILQSTVRGCPKWSLCCSPPNWAPTPCQRHFRNIIKWYCIAKSGSPTDLIGHTSNAKEQRVITNVF